MDRTKVKATIVVYPQIYAYTLPEIKRKRGWIKIGYTEKENVDERIQEQTRTADVHYQKLWSAPAKFSQQDKWFKDQQFHAYLKNYKKVAQQPGHEWFYYNGSPERSWLDYEDYVNGKFEQATQKLSYTLRAEQAEAVQKTLAYVKRHQQGEFLWNAKPRFGKTLTTYDLARKLDAKTVLVVTNRPAIATSWFDDFEKFIAWQTEYKFISETSSLKKRAVMSRAEYRLQLGDKEGYQITFVSLQDLKGAKSFGGSHEKLDWIADLKWDMLVIDESHEGIDTLKTDVAFNNLKRDFTLYLSGTPFRALASGRFKEEQIYNWTYADEQAAKEKWQDTEINNPYANLPRLNLFSYQMSPMITEKVNQGAQLEESEDYAFDLNEFFATKDNGEFVHEKQVKHWLKTLVTNEKYPFSTPRLRAELKHTFWLLHRVASAKALKKLLEADPIFKEYQIILAAGDGKTVDDQKVNENALLRVREAIEQNAKTITLSVGQLTTGVTVPEWTGVMMLSNLRSPSLYMQAAFRAQNAWRYEEDGVVKRKENAYVFDFSPERTLLLYDEFANNLAQHTEKSAIIAQHRAGIQQLLNFFPVIAEDDAGKMVELDVEQVLTIPKFLKAKEVVRRGFMSNFLFRNIAGVFSSPEAKQILDELAPVPKNKVTPVNNKEYLDTKEITVDENGAVQVKPAIVIGKTAAHFGTKVYATLEEDLSGAVSNKETKRTQAVTTAFTKNTLAGAKALAKEQGLTAKQAEQLTQKNAKVVARELEFIQRDATIKKAKVKRDFARLKAEAKADPFKQRELAQKEKQDLQAITDKVANDVAKVTKQQVETLTKEIVTKSEEKKKTTVEEDVRARLRGFARTIPAFLMAYGKETTTLANFDTVIAAHVFKEVTGITLEQFRALRDKYQFFDEVVFDEAIQTFLVKRKELANYFDESLTEDIFDYIPPQKTNQIFTPKKVVKMMVDDLQAQDPAAFTDPHKTFADLYVKSGLYLAEIVKRLYQGLAEVLPEPEKRIKHILENQIYGFAPTEIIYNIAHNYLFGFAKQAEQLNDSHLVLLDTTPFARGETTMSLAEKCDELFGGKKDEV